MSDSIDNNETEETTTTDTKTSLFKRVINAIWGGLKFCFSKFKAVFIFLGSSIIFGIFTFIVSRSSIKEKEKKNDIEENGETVKDNIDEIKVSINYILSKGYNIVSLEDLLSEKNGCNM